MEGKKKEEIRRKKMEEARKEKALKTNLKEYLKQKMKKSLSEKKNFEADKTNKNKLFYDKKDKKKKNKKLIKNQSAETIVPESTKKFKRLNAYNDVTKIINFIDNSKKNSQSKVCRNHFANIQITKNMNKTLQKMMNKNNIFK